MSVDVIKKYMMDKPNSMYPPLYVIVIRQYCNSQLCCQIILQTQASFLSISVFRDDRIQPRYPKHNGLRATNMEEEEEHKRTEILYSALGVGVFAVRSAYLPNSATPVYRNGHRLHDAEGAG